MNQAYEKLTKCVASIRERTDFKPELALILGSGLGDYAQEIDVRATVDYKDIEGFPSQLLSGTKEDLSLDMSKRFL